MDVASRQPYIDKAEAGKSKYHAWKEQMKAQEAQTAQEEAARARAFSMQYPITGGGQYPTAPPPRPPLQLGEQQVLPSARPMEPSPLETQQAMALQIERALHSSGITLNDAEKRRLVATALESGFVPQFVPPGLPMVPPPGLQQPMEPRLPPMAIAGTFLPPFLPHHPVLAQQPMMPPPPP